jgi:hypothetical protein
MRKTRNILGPTSLHNHHSSLIWGCSEFFTPRERVRDSLCYFSDLGFISCGAKDESFDDHALKEIVQFHARGACPRVTPPGCHPGSGVGFSC